MDCPNCSKELSATQQFCPNCGTKVEPVASMEATKPTSPVESNVPPSKKRVGKGLMVTALSLLLIAGATYFGFYQFMYTPEKQIEQIRTAVTSEDAKALAPLLRLKEGKVTEAQAAALLTGLSQAELTEATVGYLDRASRSIGASNEGLPLRLREIGKTYGVFKRYGLELIPQTMYVSSNFDAITVSLPDPYGKEKLESEGDQVVIRDAFPGMVEVSVKYDGQYGEDQAVKAFNSLESSNQDEPFMVAFKGLSVELDQTYNDAPLFVNGEDSGKTVGEWKTYGPVPKQGVSLSTYIEMPWGMVESKQVLAKPGGKPVKFEPKVDADTIAFTENIITRHAEEWVNFMYYEDLSALTVVTDETYLAKQRKTYDIMQAENQEWYGSFDGVEVINQKTKLTKWNKKMAIETEAVVGINSQFMTDGEEDAPQRLVKSRFRYVITEPFDDGTYHIVEATYLE
ncbi:MULTISPECIES: zinc-ribbon domain-containing protein [unclassified Exiguobacterium]|uniref:TcaA 3rd/4th domain-containing protein n=1 Tax=unclassified Exiguobacterium TaxID=2644629 RepID=UPI001BE68E38|nr:MULTISPECIES: zinc-ribbon domain-containing protein [unclassified Exiguobacterium]